MELDNVSNHLARDISGAIPETCKAPLLVVVLFLPRGATLLSSIIACMKCHVTIVVVEDTAPLSRLLFVLQDTSAFLLLTSRKLYKQINESGQCTGKYEVMFAAERYQQFLSMGLKDLALGVDILNTPPLLPSSVMCIIYTSGSTGRLHVNLIEQIFEI